MKQLQISGISEELTNVLTAAASRKLTPASILKEIVDSKNIISEYLIPIVDIERLSFDLEEEHDKLIAVNNEIVDQTIQDLNSLETDDRYTTILLFIHNAIQNSFYRSTFNKVFSKYIKIEHLYQDISNMIPNKPNLVWEDKHETILNIFGRDLSQLSIDGELSEVIGRDEEVQRMIQILTRQTKANPILLGKAGVGKTALVEKLAGVINDKQVPHSLIGYKVIELNMAKLLSDPSVEITLLAIIESAYEENAILFIDEVHLINNDKGKIANLLKPAMARGKLKLIGATTHDEYKTFEKDEAIQRRFQPITVNEPNHAEVYEILKTKAQEAEKFHNVLIPRESMLKAITLSDRYVQNRQQPDKAIDLIEEAASRLRATLESKPQVIIELQRSLGEIFIQREIIEVKSKGNISDRNQVKIDKLNSEIKIKEKELKELNIKFENQNQLLIDVIDFKKNLIELKEARDRALHFSDFEIALNFDIKEIPEMENRIQEAEKELMDMASTVDENLIQNVVVPSMIEKVIETITGIPASAQNEEDIQKYSKMEVTLKEEVHGQDKAIDTISKAIKRSKAGLSDSNKPLGSFLCLGPTGVGKTYLTQKLTEFMFDTDRVLKRFDMSEFMESHSVARLFGSPPGYVGHDEGGQLTEAIRRNPYSVILFDEIEKAHPKVFNALLQILDAGRMTDGKGNEINFKNTVIVMTSNIGSDIIRAGLENGTDIEVVEKALEHELTHHFKPEFLNRFDAKLLFNALTEEDVVKITESELKKLAERLNDNNELTLYWHPSVAGKITEEAYDLINGARPIKRFINDHIVDIITEKIMSGEINAHENSLIYLAHADNQFDVFGVDNGMLKLLREAEKTDAATKKRRKKKKKDTKIEIVTPSGETIDLSDNLNTELGD